jgi:hypothetical protein
MQRYLVPTTLLNFYQLGVLIGSRDDYEMVVGKYGKGTMVSLVVKDAGDTRLLLLMETFNFSVFYPFLYDIASMISCQSALLSCLVALDIHLVCTVHAQYKV